MKWYDEYKYLLPTVVIINGNWFNSTSSQGYNSWEREKQREVFYLCKIRVQGECLNITVKEEVFTTFSLWGSLGSACARLTRCRGGHPAAQMSACWPCWANAVSIALQCCKLLHLPYSLAHFTEKRLILSCVLRLTSCLESVLLVGCREMQAMATANRGMTWMLPLVMEFMKSYNR